jgi:hypothetical protein
MVGFKTLKLYTGLHPGTQACPVAEFIDPDCGDEVNSGIGLLYRPDRLRALAGRYDNPMPELTLSPQSGSYEFGFSTHTLCITGPFLAYDGI